MIILAVSGSLRAASYNTGLLRAAADAAADDAQVQLWDGLKRVPPYDEDDDVEPAPSCSRRPSTTRPSRGN